MLRRIALESGVVLALTSALLILAATAGLPGRPEAPQAATSETEFPDVGALHVVPYRGIPRPYLSWHELTSGQ